MGTDIEKWSIGKIEENCIGGSLDGRLTSLQPSEFTSPKKEAVASSSSINTQPQDRNVVCEAINCYAKATTQIGMSWNKGNHFSEPLYAV
jgi:hypothetical protein